MKIEDLIFKDFFEQIIPNLTTIHVRDRQSFSVTKGILRFMFSCYQRHDGTHPYSICYDSHFLFDFEFKNKNYVIGYFEEKTQSPMAEDEKQDIKSFIESFAETDSEKTQNTIKALQNLIMELE